MVKAESVIKDALQSITEKAAEIPITSDEAQTCIRAMNRLMARYAAEGINLGYTEVSSTSDDITIPDGALDGLIYGLAVAIAPQFASPDNVLVSLARELAIAGKRAMRHIAVVVEPSYYPCTLPIGSGNEGNDSLYRDRFYPCENEDITTESNQTILVEDNTDVS